MATIKGYVRSGGMDKVRTYFLSALSPKGLEMQDGSNTINLVWASPTGSFYVETTNKMANNNEILFKIPSGTILKHLQLHIQSGSYPLFAHWVLDGNGGSVNYDHVLLYNRIRLTFANANQDV